MSSRDNMMTISQHVLCLSTEILDYVERAISSMGEPTDSMVVLNQRDCCWADGCVISAK